MGRSNFVQLNSRHFPHTAAFSLSLYPPKSGLTWKVVVDYLVAREKGQSASPPTTTCQCLFVHVLPGKQIEWRIDHLSFRLSWTSWSVSLLFKSFSKKSSSRALRLERKEGTLSFNRAWFTFEQTLHKPLLLGQGGQSQILSREANVDSNNKVQCRYRRSWWKEEEGKKSWLTEDPPSSSALTPSVIDSGRHRSTGCGADWQGSRPACEEVDQQRGDCTIEAGGSVTCSETSSTYVRLPEQQHQLCP